MGPTERELYPNSAVIGDGPSQSSYTPWFAVTVKPHHEKTVSAILRNKGFEEFLPLYRVRNRWSDRVKELELPLFPSYVFCRFTAEDRVRVLRTPSIRGVVGFGDGPMPIPDREIEAVRKLVDSDLPLGPWPFLKVGHRVRITQGSMRDVEGILIQVKDSFRVVVSIELLQRSVAVTIDRDMISAVI